MMRCVKWNSASKSSWMVTAGTPGAGGGGQGPRPLVGSPAHPVPRPWPHRSLTATRRPGAAGRSWSPRSGCGGCSGCLSRSRAAGSRTGSTSSRPELGQGQGQGLTGASPTGTRAPAQPQRHLQVTDDAVGLGAMQAAGGGGRQPVRSAHQQVPRGRVAASPRAARHVRDWGLGQGGGQHWEQGAACCTVLAGRWPPGWLPRPRHPIPKPQPSPAFSPLSSRPTPSSRGPGCPRGSLPLFPAAHSILESGGVGVRGLGPCPPAPSPEVPADPACEGPRLSLHSVRSGPSTWLGVWRL